MAQNITLLGASYSDVPSVELPKTGGGTAKFDDTTISSNAASASDITSGKLAFVNGLLITGTASGGGGGGLEYETGTYTPTTDTSRPTISFSKTYSSRPIFAMITDATTTDSQTTYSNLACTFSNFYGFSGTVPNVSTTQSRRFGIAAYVYRGNGTTISQGNAQVTAVSGSSSGYITYWVTESSFTPSTNSSSRYWKAGSTYKWIAVWAPTS